MFAPNMGKLIAASQWYAATKSIEAMKFIMQQLLLQQERWQNEGPSSEMADGSMLNRPALSNDDARESHADSHRPPKNPVQRIPNDATLPSSTAPKIYVSPIMLSLIHSRIPPACLEAAAVARLGCDSGGSVVSCVGGGA